MDRNSNAYVVVFATTVCVIMAACLAFTFNSLKQQIDKNLLFDKQRNVLLAAGLYDKSKGLKTQVELEAMFAEKVEVTVLEFFQKDKKHKKKIKNEVVEVTVKEITDVKGTDIDIADIDKVRRAEPSRWLSEIYVADTGGKKVYIIPISGYGLWSTLYGFLALKDDLNEVVGITFYKHGETPGLGGEVEAVWWTENWKGRKILDESAKLVGIDVLKGVGNELGPHEVDGISGSTITGDGVEVFVRRDLENYENYFKKLRGN